MSVCTSALSLSPDKNNFKCFPKLLRSTSKITECPPVFLMSTFLGFQVDHSNDEIHLHMDTYIQGVLDEYKAFARKTLRPKKLPIAPNYQLPASDADKKLMDKDPKLFLFICDE